MSDNAPDWRSFLSSVPPLALSWSGVLSVKLIRSCWNTISVVMSILVMSPGTAHADSSSCEEKNSSHPAVEAFRTAPEISQERLQRIADSQQPSCVFLVKMGSACGVAGCTQDYLVGQRFTTKGVNPRSSSVMARVVTGPLVTSPLRIGRVIIADKGGPCQTEPD